MTINKVTGGSGNPIIDGGVRGIIFAALTTLLAFVGDKTEWLTDSDIVTLTPVVVALSFILGGLWDRFVKPKLPPAT